jgi:hypothetical protein
MNFLIIIILAYKNTKKRIQQTKKLNKLEITHNYKIKTE